MVENRYKDKNTNGQQSSVFACYYWRALREALDNNDAQALTDKLVEMISAFFPEPDQRESFTAYLRQAFSRRGNYRNELPSLLQAWQSGDTTRVHFASGTNGERLYFDGDEKIVFYQGDNLRPQLLERFLGCFGSSTISL